ncbi:hypothetical protein P5673_025678 [Acropora cervicornis]|uniref:Integrase zinc-binding domain-containing protein n=1 Tax=Acropora cervicornis TaxID=6130 RepID=A0AAD9Q1F1_ACRCE|nr:hypothetical protein P5673_025678 [Acropora cervicornis]
MIRERYWIVQARVSLRRVLNGCFDCKRTQASAGQHKIANLPKDMLESIALVPCWCDLPEVQLLEVHQSRDDGLVKSLKVRTRTSVLTTTIGKVVLLEAADQ